MTTPPANGQPVPPSLSFLARILVDVGEPVDIGRTPEGHRRIVPILGGTITGPGLQGTVLPGGADFQILRSSESTDLDARYALEIEDGSRIYVHNVAVRHGRAEDIDKLNQGQPVDASRIYFRCTPRLTTESSTWSWMNHTVFLGTGERLPNQVGITIFQVH
ncbi:hypothetical protein QFZ36_002777 [Pseudarthrobacter siccitolerans]|uniref:UPF0311 protein QFZ36_002777 n=1 Tax=Pseudarthrobacter siccitolerans TaxID=861266 RepID=A0ABU0PPR3_9MICC|nr:DUF3237 domain-containing protein [Pseudarthrobacter siccitolerans]MDQ0675216.1 hypothetical protein [Pseudarthrobacter siccitolerans]